MKTGKKNLEVPLPPELRRERPGVVRSRARGRLRAASFILLTLLGVVGARGAQLCTMPSQQTIHAASTQRWSSVKLAAQRGGIYDRNGRRLAVSVATPNIVVDPERVEPSELDSLATQVAGILELPVEEVREKMSRDSRYARLASRVHPSVAARIDDLGHTALWAERGARRYYPQAELASQVLGFVDASGRGRGGLERTLNDSLRGASILLQRRRDRRGFAVERIRARDDVLGQSVHTTLDATIQRFAENALEQILEDSDPVAATIVVMDVETSDVLAMANAPFFNPNDVGDDAARRRNHAIQDALEPGSVMKPFSVAIAVEDGVANTSDWIDCENGRYKVGRVAIHDDHPHAVVRVSDVLKYSSNIGTAKLALDVGAKKFLSALERFGFGKTTGIRLPGERRGRLRNPETIKPIELATTSYGQGMTATPLQVANATAALARGGVFMRPRLVSRVEDSHGVPELLRTPVAEHRIVSEDTATQIAAAMVTASETGGTATRARIDGYDVAVKTGTAEKVVDGRYSPTARIASMMGFVPAEDPQIAVVVMVDEPRKGSRYGGTVSGGAWASVAEQSLRYLGVPPDPAKMKDAEGVEEIEPVEDQAPVRLAWNGTAWTLPSFRGLSMRQAMRGLQGTGLGMQLEGRGEVVAQMPPAGARLRPGESVKLTFK